MFQTVPSPGVFHCTHSNGICHIGLLTACKQDQDGTDSVTYTISVCTVKNSWWWTEEMSETRTVLFQKEIWEISASSWFYYKNFHNARSPECHILFTCVHMARIKIEMQPCLYIGRKMVRFSFYRNWEISASSWFHYKNFHDARSPQCQILRKTLILRIKIRTIKVYNIQQL